MTPANTRVDANRTQLNRMTRARHASADLLHAVIRHPFKDTSCARGETWGGPPSFLPSSYKTNAIAVWLCSVEQGQTNIDDDIPRSVLHARPRCHRPTAPNGGASIPFAP